MKQPIGIELAKRGLVTEKSINDALEYKKNHPNKKLGDILYILNACPPEKLIKAIGEILEEKSILLKKEDITITPTEYITLDIIKGTKALPFDISAGKVKVCFSDTTDKRSVEKVRLLLLNKGLVMEKYITFETVLNELFNLLEGTASDNINIDTKDITGLVDSIIKTAIEKRASDIHIEPMEKVLRIRYRIDGYLTTVAQIDKTKQSQIIGRVKAISNMFQEKQESQDGRIIMYPDYNIRVSSQRNIYGEKFVLRLLKKNSNVRDIFELGFPKEDKLLKEAFNKRNSITVLAAPTGEGKTTSLYSIIKYLDKPDINIITIEDPVEIRMKGLNQVEIDSKISFSDSLRTVLRQDPDIILVGEIRDRETAEIAVQAGQTGHYVLSTIHTIDAIEVITRLRKVGVSDYDISSTLATAVSQRLVRKVCKHCAVERDYNEEEKQVMEKIMNKYGRTIDFKGKKTYTAVGCEKCNNTGYFDRIGIFEILTLDDETKELITRGASSIEIRRDALKRKYKPLIIDGIEKILDGVITLEELNNKLAIY
ncbi:MAG: GspE/PulE family protein [Clostridia bacterium]|nr:GspE/PulE family protein [Clostridia bacterium]